MPVLGMVLIVVGVVLFYWRQKVNQEREDELLMRGEFREKAPRGIGRVLFDIAPLVLRMEHSTSISIDHPKETLQDFVQANLEGGEEFRCEHGKDGIAFHFGEHFFRPRILDHWFRFGFDGGEVAIEAGATTYKVVCRLNFTTIWVVVLALGAVFTLVERDVFRLLFAALFPLPSILYARFMIGRRIQKALEQLEETYGNGFAGMEDA